MQVFKFGGASVKHADAVKNIVPILRDTPGEVVVVISAMGKTTNALERITDQFVKGESDLLQEGYEQLRSYHLEIAGELFPDHDHSVFTEIEKLFQSLLDRLQEDPTLNYDFDYDQIIGYGELLSTTIVSWYLAECGLANRWLDIRKSLKTDDTFREGRIDWEVSSRLVKKHFVFKPEQVLVTQGFLASDMNNMTVSLGREGSDYTAAILAYILEAEKVTIWKDVPGVLNADPKYFDHTILLEQQIGRAHV